MHTTNIFPEIVSLGIAYRPGRKWTVSFELEWLGWSAFDQTDIELEKKVPEAGITNRSIPLDWKDTWIIKIGTEYKLLENLSLRGGYAYVQTPVPEHTLSPANPDSNQHNFSVGMGYRKGKVVLDLFYAAGFSEDLKVRNNILNGEYENFAHYLGFSMGIGL
jgi:long-chain fatty acid transport protein